MNDSRCSHCGASLDAEGACPKCLMVVGLETDAALPFGGGDVRAPDLRGFTILGEVGRGGMGVVYQARHERLERTVAIKVLPPEMRHVPGFAERFRREACAMAGLSHQNVVAVHDFGESNGVFYLVMEFVEGVNLRQLMQEGMNREQALDVVDQVCDALQYAHEEGVVHRDIKPENILIDKKGRVKLGDFGLAKMLGSADTRLTASRHVMGTPHYMAPEQVNAPLEVDHRADVYALGVVLYELLTGEVPIGQFAPPSERGRGDARLDDVVLRALEHSPERRFQSASELQLALWGQPEAARGSTGTASATPRARAPIPASRGSRHQTQPLPFWLQYWELPLCALGVLGCLAPWGTSRVVARELMGIETAGGAITFVAFVILPAVWLGLRSRRIAVPLPVYFVTGAGALAGVVIAEQSVRGNRSFLVATGAIAVGVMIGGALRLCRRGLAQLGRITVPDPLATRVKVATMIVALGGVSTFFLPWYRVHRGWSYYRPIRGYESVYGGTVFGFFLAILVALVVSRGLALRRWDGWVSLGGGLAAVLVSLACMADRSLFGEATIVAIGTGLGCAVGGLIMLLNARNRNPTFLASGTWPGARPDPGSPR